MPQTNDEPDWLHLDRDQTTKQRLKLPNSNASATSAVAQTSEVAEVLKLPSGATASRAFVYESEQ
jgi:hypothetical protein